MLNYTLGTIEASEALIKDLYIDLRAKVNAWSKITQQTPQARMGYVGQHNSFCLCFKKDFAKGLGSLHKNKILSVTLGNIR